MCNIVEISKRQMKVSFFFFLNSCCECNAGGLCKEKIYFCWKDNAQKQEKGPQGRIYFSCSYCPWQTCFFLKLGSEKLFSNMLQQIQMPLYEVLNMVCKTSNSVITVQVFSAALRRSIFDLETSIESWILSGQGVDSKDFISFFSFCWQHILILPGSWSDCLIVLVFKIPR